jgi:hypothetical protein
VIAQIPHRPRPTLPHASLLVLSLACASSLAAQSLERLPFPLRLADSAPDWVWRMPEPSGCLASIPATSMHHVPVHLSADMLPVTDTILTLQSDLMAQDVATEMRALLDTTHMSMLDVDGKLTWYSVPSQIVVIVHADGSESWRVKGSQGDLTAARLLGAAFDSAIAHGNARVVWPEGIKTDSLIVRLSLVPQYQGYDPTPEHSFDPEKEFTVFALTEPDVTAPVIKAGEPPPKYPSFNERHRVEGAVLMQLIVDSTGRTDPSSIHDLWPASWPRLDGYEAEYYNWFVESVTRWSKQVRFEPRRIAGCAVRQVVRIPLTFVAPGSLPRRQRGAQ